jgi:hypothetical protein
VAYSETINLVVGDTRPLLRTTLRDRNTAAPGQTLRPNDPLTWAPINLVDATVRMYIRVTGVTGAPSSTITASAVDLANGQVAFQLPSDAFPAGGTYDAEIEITYADSGIQTLQDFIKFKVRDQVG